MGKIAIRPVLFEDGICKIPLTKNKFAIVDADDAPLFSAFNWYAVKAKMTHYAYRDIRVDGKKKTIRMHSLIFSNQQGLMIDHINGDGLDNRRCNLRLVTNQQNSFNSRIRPSSASGYKGVTASKRCGRWLARITHNGVMKNLGRYETKELAHEAYQRAALSLFGEFANFG